MKQKHKYVIGALVIIVLAAAGGLFFMNQNAADAAPPSKNQSVASKFSFTGTTDWWQGATNETSMALFHDYDCFASAQYYTGTIDVAAELQKLQTSQAGDGGTSTPGAVLPEVLQTSTGQQQYELHQYTLTNSVTKLMRGLELGYLQLPGGYVKIEGRCDTPEKLPTTIPALQAIKFKAAN